MSAFCSGIHPHRLIKLTLKLAITEFYVLVLAKHILLFLDSFEVFVVERINKVKTVIGGLKYLHL